MGKARELGTPDNFIHQIRPRDLAHVALSLQPSYPHHRGAVGYNHCGVSECARNGRIASSFEHAMNADRAHISFGAEAEKSLNPVQSVVEIDRIDSHAQHIGGGVGIAKAAIFAGVGQAGKVRGVGA
jgi:hypothetical protein